MKKMFAVVLGIALAVFALAPGAFAQPEKTDGFVCPVFHSDAVGEHNPNAVQIAGGDYTVLGPEVSVPIHATNGNGQGTPGGDHSSPGDSDYTAVWS